MRAEIRDQHQESDQQDVVDDQLDGQAAATLDGR